MVRVALLAACLCTLAACAAGSRLLLQDGLVEAAASASALDCTRVHRACNVCRNQRIPGTKRTDTVCSSCRPGWRLRRDGKSKICDCNSGFAMDGSGNCVSCPFGKYCPGGDAKANPLSQAYDCSEGLATKFAGAKSIAQCFTLPGYGRKSVRQGNGQVTFIGVPCPIGTFNIGGNTAGCQSCNPGLTTASTGSNASTACVAPAGSYMDKLIGKRCPRGTFSTELNTQPACTPCNEGVTTVNEGSTSPALCNRALKGYYYVSADFSAVPCPLNTYNDNETTLSYCTDCPYGWKTQKEGADGMGSCLAPPGFELKDGADAITECEIGFYKADWNRNNCTKCGVNIDTEESGSVSKDACRVPAGYGIISMLPLAAAMCVQGSFGDPMPRPATFSARCVNCPANFMTVDMFTGVPATEGYTSESFCVLEAGWGTTQSNLVEKCQRGTFNTGGNRQPCTECPSGYTTLQEASANSSQCVVQPGWELDVALNIPKPCDKGFYSTGGTVENRNAVCQQCPDGFTTQESESTTSDECSLCEAGRGGDGCGLCAYDTWSSGQTSPGDGCSNCANGAVSARGASSPDECFPAMDAPGRDIFHLADDSLWEDDVTSSSFSSCQASCRFDESCMQMRFNEGTGSCQLLKEDPSGTQLVGFKAPFGVDYAFYNLDESTVIGVQVDSVQSGLTQKQCMDACNRVGNCEAVSFVPASGNCKLLTSELDSEWSAMIHFSGSKLFSDLSL